MAAANMALQAATLIGDGDCNEARAPPPNEKGQACDGSPAWFKAEQANSEEARKEERRQAFPGGGRSGVSVPLCTPCRTVPCMHGRSINTCEDWRVRVTLD